MLRRLLVLGLILGLVGCETISLDRDYDRSRDFAAYRTWAWAQPAFEYRPDDPRIKSDITEQRIREAVADQLDQRGLRPAQSGSAADLKARAYLIVDQRQQQYTSNYGGWGYWGGCCGGYWGAPYVESRTVYYKVATIQVDLLDGKDGKLVWRGSGEKTVYNDAPTPTERESAIREAVQKVLAQYPPH
ncbi:DUF4136 domain-containing protein [Pseudomonas schmalbachii]|uniref:DUF4136 domain-containing protein n=1 Tax=Pseudomonas schmalbachii TaxID=2816993 RepID=A0ABS3TNC9_9PSED|nr:DUF4136 domain-containing protein [Pseudomonas schmalbachii]MBO3275170.1 DUF4136 domain-containing protein [Pseudomonas schmalbachii]